MLWGWIEIPPILPPYRFSQGQLFALVTFISGLGLKLIRFFLVAYIHPESLWYSDVFVIHVGYNNARTSFKFLWLKEAAWWAPVRHHRRLDPTSWKRAQPNHNQLSLMTVFTWIPLITMLWSPNLKKDEMGNKSICVWMLLSESALHIYVHNYENEHLSSVKRDNLQPCFSINEKVLTNI